MIDFLVRGDIGIVISIVFAYLLIWQALPRTLKKIAQGDPNKIKPLSILCVGVVIFLIVAGGYLINSIFMTLPAK
jgi:Na+/H+ antiporter NhaD/arsenite permease-like protein